MDARKCNQRADGWVVGGGVTAAAPLADSRGLARESFTTGVSLDPGVGIGVGVGCSFLSQPAAVRRIKHAIARDSFMDNLLDIKVYPASR
jgi:hypothetical protein